MCLHGRSLLSFLSLFHFRQILTGEDTGYSYTPIDLSVLLWGIAHGQDRSFSFNRAFTVCSNGAYGFVYFSSYGLATLGYHRADVISFFVATSATLAAIGLGVLLGTLCQTQEQSAPLGATLTVILAAIGGVWIPVLPCHLLCRL